MAEEKRIPRSLKDVDREIIDLLAERARMVQASDDKVLETQSMDEICAQARAVASPLGQEAISNVYREILSACRALNAPVRVAYLGPQGTFCEMAMIGHFGHSVKAVACADIDDVVRTAEAGEADYAVVPIENSTQGTVTRTLDLLMNTPLTIVGEVNEPIVHNLMGRAKSLSEVRRVCAHPQALAQCHHWLATHLPGIECVPAASNAKAAQDAADDPRLAAIAASRASELYGLEILAAAIQDNACNRTRFLVLGSDAPNWDKTCPMRTSVVFSVANVAGALFRALEPFYTHKVSMVKLESRPARNGSWEYNFYVDLEGHMKETSLMLSLDQMKPFTKFFKLLGSYPRAKDIP